MLAVHNVSPPPKRLNKLKSPCTTLHGSCKSTHNSDSDSSTNSTKILKPYKRFKFDNNSKYCGLENTLRQMNVEHKSGENSPEEFPCSSSNSFLTIFGSSRKRQSSLSHSFSQSWSPQNPQFDADKSKSTSVTNRFNKNFNNSPTQFKNKPLFNNKFNEFNDTAKSSDSKQDFKNSSDSEAVEIKSDLKKPFIQKFNYKRRLKHLPSQLKNLNKSPSSISLKNTGNTVHLADALTIFEELLNEREEKLKEEFNMELQNQMAEQYEQFVRYNEDAVRSKVDNSCSYLS